jgi:hypothetical protein
LHHIIGHGLRVKQRARSPLAWLAGFHAQAIHFSGLTRMTFQNLSSTK